MNITNAYLLEYIAARPELSGWNLVKVERSQFWPDWQKFQFQLCHTSLTGASLSVVSIYNSMDQVELSKALRSEMGAPNAGEEEALMLHGC